jgi:hypothetical protein
LVEATRDEGGVSSTPTSTPGAGLRRDTGSMAISKRQAVHWMFAMAIVVKAANGILEIVA